MVISGIGVCDHFLQQRFPHHNTTAAITFNSRLKELVKLTYPSLSFVMIDFLDATERAIADGRTSGGHHFLRDVNLIKAMSILNVMERMAVEPIFSVTFA